MGTTEWLIILVVIAAAVVGGYLFFNRKTGEDQNFYHFRCPSCRRRLRFQQRQVGHKGQCSNCGKEVVFPPVSQAID